MLSKFEPLTNAHAADDIIAFRIKDVVGVNVSGSFNDERLNATNQSLVCSHKRGDTAVKQSQHTKPRSLSRTVSELTRK